LAFSDGFHEADNAIIGGVSTLFFLFLIINIQKKIQIFINIVLSFFQVQILASEQKNYYGLLQITRRVPFSF